MGINIAIIPARAGSKRLPNKNIKKLKGKPLIAWTIEAALDYGKFDLVIVSTDSQDIAHISKEYGAFVPFLRPAELASDIATTNDVVSHLVHWVENNVNKVTKITLLQPTSPLRDSEDISKAMGCYEENKAMAVISVCELEHPMQYCNILPEDLSMSGFISKVSNKRSQDLEKYYRINGAIYIFDRKYVGSLSDIYSEGSYAYVMNKMKSIDIDDEFDFRIAELLKND